MTMFISKSKNKRELATVCRMGFEMAGILLALILQGVVIGNRETECLTLSSNLTAETSTAETTLTSIINIGTKRITKATETTLLSTIFSKWNFLYETQKYFVAATIFMIIYFICMILFFVGTKENLGMKFKDFEYFFSFKSKLPSFRSS
jgi:Na+/melibiose symporter-like transporter